MNRMRDFGSSLLFALAAAAHSEAPPKDVVIKDGPVLQVSAYVDRNYRASENSRYAVFMIQPSKDLYQWDWTTPDDPNEHNTNLSGGISPVPYGSKQQTILHIVLHQYDTYDERVTFTNLDLGPLSANPIGVPIAVGTGRPDVTPRFLSITKPLTFTTPSGITISLPIQGAETLSKVFSNFSGNANALFIQIETAPSQREVLLPLSPLYKKHHKPARIKLECLWPDMLVSYDADNTYKTIAVGMSGLNTVRHLDTFTLIVRQRVELKTMPVSILLPISHSRG